MVNVNELYLRPKSTRRKNFMFLASEGSVTISMVDTRTTLLNISRQNKIFSVIFLNLNITRKKGRSKSQ